MGRKKLTKHPKEKFIAPRVVLSAGLDLEEALLGASKDVPMTIVDTGHESYTYTPDVDTNNYWE